jgi:hypothetical protein
VAKVVWVNSRPYSALGEVLDELARKRNVRGPYSIANYMKTRVGEAPTEAAVSQWMYGDSNPTRENMHRFADAFELSKREKITLSFAFTYGQQPPEDAYSAAPGPSDAPTDAVGGQESASERPWWRRFFGFD